MGLGHRKVWIGLQFYGPYKLFILQACMEQKGRAKTGIWDMYVFSGICSEKTIFKKCCWNPTLCLKQAEPKCVCICNLIIKDLRKGNTRLDNSRSLLTEHLR